MAYAGDGRYKFKYFDKEISLIDLITAEDEAVDTYNDKMIAYNTAKKNNMNTTKYENDVKEAKKKVDEARRNLTLHLSNKFGIKTDLIDQIIED